MFDQADSPGATGALTVDGLRAATVAYEAALGLLDPKSLVRGEPARAMDVLVQTANKIAAAKMALALRIVDTGAWAGQGHRSQADWLAATCGITAREARRILDTAEKLEDLPEVADAAKSGGLSPGQTEAIARGAAAQPDRAGELMDKAKKSTLRQLNQAADDAEAAAAGPDRLEAQRRRAHNNRAVNAYYNGGEGKMVITDSADRIAKMMAAVDDGADKKFVEHTKSGVCQPVNQYKADVVYERLTGDDDTNNDGGGVGTEVVLVVDLNLVRRDDTAGATAEGTCRIDDVGPVSPATARQWIMGDAFLKVVVTDGVDVQHVWHGGRHVPAHLKTALLVRDPCCVVPGCGTTFNLEVDHIDPHGDGGPTAVWNLRRPCRRHHQMRTHQGWKIQGTAGDWRWVDPNDVIIAADNVDLIGRSTADEPAPTYQPPQNYKPGTTNTGRPDQKRAGPAPPPAGGDPDPPGGPEPPGQADADCEPATLFGDDP